MKNVKPKAGQVWQSKSELDFEGLPRGEFKIIEVNHSAILIKLLKFDYIITVDARTFYSGYEFTPIGDLEWLAVNVDKWKEGADFLSKESQLGDCGQHIFFEGEFWKSKELAMEDAVIREQWQNMRYELGLDGIPTLNRAPQPATTYAASVETIKKQTEMSTEKMIPIDFSRNITPFIIGDKFYSSSDGIEFYAKTEFDLEVLNDNSGIKRPHLFVVSFADRPNTGTQPVGDDVVVDFFMTDGDERTELANSFPWQRKPKSGFYIIKTWKPNHAAMLANYQQSQLAEEAKRMDNNLEVGRKWTPNKPMKNFTVGKCYAITEDTGDGDFVIEDDYSAVPHNCSSQWVNENFTLTEKEQAHHIALQIEALGDVPKPSQELVDLLHKDVGFSGLDELINPDEKVNPISHADMVAKLETQVTNNECEVWHGSEWHKAIKLGVDIYGNFAYQISSGEFKGEFNATPTRSDFRPIQTAEQKLAEELSAAMSDSVDGSLIGYANYLIRRYNITKKDD